MKRITAAAIGTAALLFLGGCGSGSDESTSMNTPTPTATATEMPSAAAAGTIVEVASGNPDFSTLVTAVTAAGLADELSGTGPFTVFAPTNEAFEALPAGVLDSLLKPDNAEALKKVLLYHVVNGEVMAADVKPGEVTTLEGSELTVTTDNGVKVGDATVITTDVDASNGVIHAIDAVLVPPTVDPAALK